MKAMAYNTCGPPEVLREMNLTTPEPGPDEVLVRVCATSVNPLDWQLRSRKARVRRKTGFPFVPGPDVSGVVERVGDKAGRFRPGDEVFGLLDYRRDGGAAEFVCTREAFLHAKPPSLSHLEAATVPLAALTALQALRLKARMKEGERVLALGASGGVGHFAVQIAAAYGARVTATCAAHNAEFVRGLGAHGVIAYDQEEIPKEAMFDVVFDTVRASCFKDMVPHLNPRGRYVSTLPDIPGVVRARLARLLGFTKRCLYVMVLPDPHGLRYLYELIEDGRLRPHIQEVFPLAELAAAHRLSEDGHVVGKLAVRVADAADPG